MLFVLALLSAEAPPPLASGRHATTCGLSRLSDPGPAERLAALDAFRDHMRPADRARLDRALPRGTGGGIARCDATDGSRASCEAAAYAPALRATGLMPRFVAGLCHRRD